MARGVPRKHLARRHGLSAHSLDRHWKRHVPEQVKAARMGGVDSPVDAAELRRTESGAVPEHLVPVRARLWALVQSAEEVGDHRGAGMLLGRLDGNPRPTAELLGDLRQHHLYEHLSIGVLVGHPEYLRLRQALVEAVRAHSGAREAVLGALRRVELEGAAVAERAPGAVTDARG